MTAVGLAGVKNRKTDGSQYFKTNIIPHFDKESIGNIQYNGKMINMILSTKICIKFHAQVLTLSVGYGLLPHNFILKSLSNFFCLDLKTAISIFLH